MPTKAKRLKPLPKYTEKDAFKLPEKLEEVAMKWVKYGQSDCDPNDISYAVHAAVAEAGPVYAAPILAAVKYTVENPCEDIHQFLGYWLEGNWSALRNNWPDAPAEIYPPGA